MRNLELAGVPRSVAMAMVGHKTEAIYRRYAIVDAKSMRAAAEKLGQLHEQQAQARCKLVPMELVAWDGVERPTRGFSAGSAT